MSNLLVGMRVRINFPPEPLAHGKEATIVGVDKNTIWSPFSPSCKPNGITSYAVSIDGLGGKSNLGNQLAYEAHELIPLTDPKADEFIESLKRLGQEPLVPVVKGEVK